MDLGLKDKVALIAAGSRGLGRAVAEELAAEITKHLPGFTCHYSPDFHQEIADSWPQVIDDSQARKDWHWQPEYTLSSMVEDMLEKLSQKLALAGNGQSLARSSHSNRP